MTSTDKLLIVLVLAISLVLLYLIFSDIYFGGRREMEFEVFKELNIERNNILTVGLNEQREYVRWVKTEIPKAPRKGKPKIETPIKFAADLKELNTQLNGFSKKST